MPRLDIFDILNVLVAGHEYFVWGPQYGVGTVQMNKIVGVAGEFGEWIV